MMDFYDFDPPDPDKKAARQRIADGFKAWIAQLDERWAQEAAKRIERHAARVRRGNAFWDSLRAQEEPLRPSSPPAPIEQWPPPF